MMSEKVNEPKDPKSWRYDSFAANEVLGQQWGCLIGPLLLVVISVLAGALLPAISFFRARSVVIVYAAQDREYSEPILKQFKQETGIRVKAIYDSEAVKTVGLANRLLAERARPQCDVFWGNEELRTRQLAAQKVFHETNGWAAFGHRSRRIVINTNLVAADAVPRSFIEFTNAIWRGKIAIAYPLFGTTATHFLALRQHWGESNWLAWCHALQSNQPRILDGNSMVVRQVGRGEAAIGLTDSDDIAAGQQENLPVAALPLNAETLLIPNTVAVIRGAPHAEAAQKLFIFLQSPAVAARLVSANALESATLGTTPSPTLQPDWDALLQDLDAGTKELQGIFRR
jgi:iron(III) transport system substrate-binding protein